MKTRHVPCPLGELVLVADDAALLAVHLPNGSTPAPPEAGDDRRHPLLAAAARQLDEYFAGTRRAFDLPLRPAGTEFQRAVWTALYAIPFGATRSYGEIAITVGKPTASRAIGAANGQNPIAIIIPCHRVIGANGTLTGYGGGLPAKQWLLEHEGSLAPAPRRQLELLDG
jgi:methylated-DNA-[protein]-cysteine S-methyltransferase